MLLSFQVALFHQKRMRSNHHSYESLLGEVSRIQIFLCPSQNGITLSHSPVPSYELLDNSAPNFSKEDFANSNRGCWDINVS